ncbi:E3 ubiquitin-protein ligase RSL1-like [Lathyrus oleraceus]|uniref:E3 ubiquitin-protein ligase RSL1-like n=1 Tax=Pisum sativum TaxID=3888 RepID=UPI0021D05290|nr:E3 ubiquitin-protein ligase RSL1-like [Pisum sativum]
MEGASSSSTTPDHDEEIFQISDEKYAEELRLQEALYFSRTSNTTVTEEEEIQEVEERVETKTLVKSLIQKLKNTMSFEGESSSGSSLKQSYCGICMEAKPVEKMFENPNCSHSFCVNCVGKFLAVKVQENRSTVKCPYPKCDGILEPHDCSSVIPKDLLDRWENAICEETVLSSEKFYCPFKDCSAMLVNDEKEAVVTSSECPHCHRLFCAQCKVSWHAGVDCEEFQSLKDGERGREDMLAMELAKNKRWKRCPKCGFYVERIVGCTRITCRYANFTKLCGNQFCYGCGSASNRDDHYHCATQ